ncbi:MAG: tripartite tricarboxylate transporter substrate binding protein [bacterium]|nr:tripartite tricarboxylate transporter substrate binding protein [bacterium]
MKKIALVLIFAVGVSCFAVIDRAQAEFPKKPITFMIYTKPGGLADVSARKIIAIAAKYTDVTFVALNKPGAGGIVAMKAIQQGKTDGHTILMATMSNIAKVVTSKGDINLDDFIWLAMLVSDSECIITNSTKEVNTWEQLVEDAKAKGGKQIWVGPAAGGRDHVMAMKVWENTGVEAKWIPYASGGKSMAALLGGHGVAYVGNPLDTIGKPDLKVAAISRTERLEQFPDAPTFKELGYEGLDNEIMWRGVLVKNGTDPEALAFYADLFQKVAKDPEWIAFLGKGGADAVYYGPEKFTEIVKQNAEEFTTYLKKIGVLK